MCRADAVKQELLFGCGPHLHPLGAGCLPGGAIQEERIVQHVGIMHSKMSIELRQNIYVVEYSGGGSCCPGPAHCSYAVASVASQGPMT